MLLDQNKLFIVSTTLDDFGFYELFTIVENEYKLLKKAELKYSNEQNIKYHVLGDTIELVSEYSKYYRLGPIYWRKLSENESSFNFDYYAKEINRVNYFILI